MAQDRGKLPGMNEISGSIDGAEVLETFKRFQNILSATLHEEKRLTFIQLFCPMEAY